MLHRRELLTFGAAGLGVSLTGCVRRRSETLRIGYLPISESLPLFTAVAEGDFERAGVSVETIALDSGPRIVEAMNGGSIDVGLINYVSLLLARAAGLDYRIIAGSTVETRSNPQHALLARDEEALARGQRRIAINGRRNINELFTRAYLSQRGLAPEQVQLVEVPFPRMLPALTAGSIDVAGAIEPFVSFGRRDPAIRVLGRQITDVADNVPIACWVVRGDLVQARMADLDRFRTAVSASVERIGREPEGARPILSTFTRLTPEDVSVVPLPTFGVGIPEAGINDLVRRVRDAGWIEEPLPVSSFVVPG